MKIFSNFKKVSALVLSLALTVTNIPATSVYAKTAIAEGESFNEEKTATEDGIGTNPDPNASMENFVTDLQPITVTEIGEYKAKFTFEGKEGMEEADYFLGYGETREEAEAMIEAEEKYAFALPEDNFLYYNHIEPGKKYYVLVVYAEYKGEETTYVPWADGYFVTLPEFNWVSMERIQKGKNVKFKWKNNGSFDETTVTVNINGKKISKSTTKNKVTFKNLKLKKNTSYDVTLQSSRTIDGKKYYSNVYKNWIQYGQPKVKKIKLTNGKLKIKWNKIKNADSYRIYITDKKKNKNNINKYRTYYPYPKKNFVTIKNFDSIKIKENKTYYVVVATNNNYYYEDGVCAPLSNDAILLRIKENRL